MLFLFPFLPFLRISPILSSPFPHFLLRSNSQFLFVNSIFHFFFPTFCRYSLEQWIFPAPAVCHCSYFCHVHKDTNTYMKPAQVLFTSIPLQKISEKLGAKKTFQCRFFKDSGTQNLIYIFNCFNENEILNELIFVSHLF